MEINNTHIHIGKEFQKREEYRETPEVHVAGICIKHENEILKILISKRSEERRLFPGLYEGCGGQLRYNETFEQGAIRHYRTEFNITVHPTNYYITYSICEPGIPIIPGIRYLCEYVEGDPSSANHTEHRWVSQTEMNKLPADAFIPGLRNQVNELLTRYKNEMPVKKPPK